MSNLKTPTIWQKAATLIAMLPVFVLAIAASASAADLSNTARARATAPGGAVNGVVSADDTVDIPVVTKAPEYTVAKSVTPGITTNGNAGIADAVGDTLVYTFEVENTGNVTLNSVVLSDPGPLFGGVAGSTSAAYVSSLAAAVPTQSGATGVPTVNLDIGETWTYTVTYTLSQADIDNAVAFGATNNVTNTVSATADDPQGDPVAPEPTGSTLTATTTIAPDASLTIAKSAKIKKFGSASFVAILPTDVLEVGDEVEYSYLVTNDGNVTLTGVNVDETAFTGNGGIVPPAPTGGASTLAPGANTTFTSVYTVTQADVDGLQP